jgi:hypothetical protein
MYLFLAGLARGGPAGREQDVEQYLVPEHVSSLHGFYPSGTSGGW